MATLYQLVIQDKVNKERYISTIALKESELDDNNIKAAAQMEHLKRNPDDKMLDKEYKDEIFLDIDVIGLVPIEFNPISL